MGKGYVPWPEASLTVSRAVKKPQLTLLWEEFNSPALKKGEAEECKKSGIKLVSANP